jgi:hypothetical protein
MRIPVCTNLVANIKNDNTYRPQLSLYKEEKLPQSVHSFVLSIKLED